MGYSGLALLLLCLTSSDCFLETNRHNRNVYKTDRDARNFFGNTWWPSFKMEDGGRYVRDTRAVERSTQTSQNEGKSRSMIPEDYRQSSRDIDTLRQSRENYHRRQLERAQDVMLVGRRREIRSVIGQDYRETSKRNTDSYREIREDYTRQIRLAREKDGTFSQLRVVDDRRQEVRSAQVDKNRKDHLVDNKVVEKREPREDFSRQNRRILDEVREHNNIRRVTTERRLVEEERRSTRREPRRTIITDRRTSPNSSDRRYNIRDRRLIPETSANLDRRSNNERQIQNKKSGVSRQFNIEVSHGRSVDQSKTRDNSRRLLLEQGDRITNRKNSVGRTVQNKERLISSLDRTRATRDISRQLFGEEVGRMEEIRNLETLERQNIRSNVRNREHLTSSVRKNHSDRQEGVQKRVILLHQSRTRENSPRQLLERRRILNSPNLERRDSRSAHRTIQDQERLASPSRQNNEYGRTVIRRSLDDSEGWNVRFRRVTLLDRATTKDDSPRLLPNLEKRDIRSNFADIAIQDQERLMSSSRQNNDDSRILARRNWKDSERRSTVRNQEHLSSTSRKNQDDFHQNFQIRVSPLKYFRTTDNSRSFRSDRDGRISIRSHITDQEGPQIEANARQRREKSGVRESRRTSIDRERSVDRREIQTSTLSSRDQNNNRYFARNVADSDQRQSTTRVRKMIASFKPIGEVDYMPDMKTTVILYVAKALLVGFLVAQVISNSSKTKKNWFNNLTNFVAVTKEKVL